MGAFGPVLARPQAPSGCVVGLARGAGQVGEQHSLLGRTLQALVGAAGADVDVPPCATRSGDGGQSCSAVVRWLSQVLYSVV